MANEIVLQSEMAYVPAIITQTGGNARFAYDEFFKASVNNPHTRRAYSRIVDRFLNWCLERSVELHRITPDLAGDYIGQLEGSAPTKNQALAALRHFFDALVQRMWCRSIPSPPCAASSTASPKAKRRRSVSSKQKSCSGL